MSRELVEEMMRSGSDTRPDLREAIKRGVSTIPTYPTIPNQPPSPRSPLYGNYVRTPVNLTNLELGQSLFSMPQAADLFPPAALNPNDLESFRRSTVTKTLVRDLHAELYRLRDMAARKRTELSASEIRGRVEGVEWVLSQLESYYMPESDRRDDDADDSSSDPAMTVEFDA